MATMKVIKVTASSKFIQMMKVYEVEKKERFKKHFEKIKFLSKPLSE